MEYKFNADNKTPSSWYPKIVSYNDFSTSNLYKIHEYYTELEEKNTNKMLLLKKQIEDVFCKWIMTNEIYYFKLMKEYKELLQFYKNQSYINSMYCKLIHKELKKRNIIKE